MCVVLCYHTINKQTHHYSIESLIEYFIMNMVAPKEDFIDIFYCSIGDLHSVRKCLNEEYAACLKEICQIASKDISNHTGKFLHTLQKK